MSTADEIRGKITTAQRTIEDKKRERLEAQHQRELALERQALRKELEGINNEIRTEEEAIDRDRIIRSLIDQDLWSRNGPAPPDQTSGIVRPKPYTSSIDCTPVLYKSERHSTSSAVVANAEYVWKIGEFSWLLDGMKQDALDCVASPNLECGDSTFFFQYTPGGGEEGTLAIWHDESRSGSVTFRYKVFIRRKGGAFIQWGETGNVCLLAEEGAMGIAFGPDVPSDGSSTRPARQGIFGLNHHQLIDSEWVEDDALTVRFELSVRLALPVDDVPTSSPVEVPASTIAADMLSYLNSERFSDVTIFVDGETIKAHSQILCSRSEVFDKLLTSGMKESHTKEVHIDDCTAVTFKALLRFIYCDDLKYMEEAMREETKPTQPDGGDGKSRRLWFEKLLALSHKYELTRLQAWCARKLHECISVNEVCSILTQAHLYNVKQLTEACLIFIRENFSSVCITEDFGRLAKDWPEVVVKINVNNAGVSEKHATAALTASTADSRTSTKRKRVEGDLSS